MQTLPAKDPTETLPYSCAFTAFLESGDTITSAQVVASPSGLTITSPVVVDAVVTVFVTGGTLGANYEISFEIATTFGWTVKRSGILPVRDR
jgi:hypothetical protein